MEAQQQKRMQDNAAAHGLHPVLTPHSDDLVPELCCGSAPQSLIWQPVTADKFLQALCPPSENTSWEAQHSEWTGAHALLRPLRAFPGSPSQSDVPDSATRQASVCAEGVDWHCSGDWWH